MVNTGAANRPAQQPYFSVDLEMSKINRLGNTKKRSLLDYSLIICGGIILLLIILVMKGESLGSISASANNRLSGLSGSGQIEVSSAELLEVEEELREAKKVLEEKKAEVSKVVEKVEKEVTPQSEKPHTESEKLEEAKKEEEIVEAVVDKELGLDKFCAACQYKKMSFNCGTRVKWMMDSYGITEEVAKESVIHICHYRRIRG